VLPKIALEGELVEEPEDPEARTPERIHQPA
jgi:hypothetical protein